MVLSKTLKITAQAKQSFNLAIFNKPIPIHGNLYQDVFPTVWKSLHFENSSVESVNFSMNLKVFIADQSRDFARVMSSQYIAEGESITVDSNQMFERPTQGSHGAVSIVNNSGSLQNFGYQIDGKPAALFVNVSNGNQIMFRVEPKIWLGILNFRDGEVIRSEFNATAIDLNNISSEEVNILVSENENGWKITY